MKQTYLITGLLISLLILPVTFFLYQSRQNIRSSASAATTIELTPSSSSSNPIQKQIGETASLDLMLNPHTNAISTLKIHLIYNPTIFQAVTNNDLVINTTAFPATIEGPVIDTTKGNIYITLSVGADPTKAINTTVKVATLNLKPINSTSDTSTMVTFGSATQAFSVAATDASSENVLSTTTPAYLIISSPITPTITLAPTVLPTATPTNQPSATPTIIPSVTPTTIQPTTAATNTPAATATTAPNTTVLAFTAFLHGVGASGDNTNPTMSSLSNKTPKNPTRQVVITIYDSLNQLITTEKSTMSYNETDGNFAGKIQLPQSLVTGDYLIKIKTENHLQKRFGGIIHILAGTITTLPAVIFTVGDINNDNRINIIDYNLLIGCYSDLLPAVSCEPTTARLTDLNDDGAVNQTDYNLFLREITVQSGD
jgi:hypothetical protein